MRNYMDLFQTPEEYILHRVETDLGTQNCISKVELLKMAKMHGIIITPDSHKSEIARLVMKKIGAEAFAEKCEHLGVSNYGMQQKFGISHADLRRLTRIGFLQVTGKERFGKPGAYHYADLYSVFQYFQLTKEDVQMFLEEMQEI